MATNDFTHDLLDKLVEDKVEYLLITIQKGKAEHKSSAYYNIATVDGLDMIVTTIDEVIKNVADDTTQPGELECGDDDDDFEILS